MKNIELENAINFLNDRGYTNPVGIEFTANLLIEYQKLNNLLPKERLIDFKKYWKRTSHQNIDEAIKGYMKYLNRK